MKNKYSIVVLDGIGVNPGDLSWDALRELGDVTIFENTQYEQIIERAYESEIVVVNKCKFDEHIISRLPKLRFICESATGYDNIDIAVAKKYKISVSNVRDYSTESVVQHVFALILGLINKVEYYSKQVHEGRWSKNDFFTFWDSTMYELAGKTIGIYGFGKIGSRVAQVANAFGMKVIALRKDLSKPFPDYVECVGFERLLKESDILTLHAPLISENIGLINSSNLKEMKPGALLINTSRGKVIDEAALRYALDRDIIAGAGLDVLSVEPPENDNPLLNAKHCLITPHQAWTSLEARQKLLEIIILNIRQFINGTPINTLY